MASLSKNQEFYAEVYETARELGYSPAQAELAASQAYHESMSKLGVAGGSGLAKNHNNLFGMKAGSSWRGPVANMKTQEEVKGKNVTIKDAFRAYPSRRDSIIDYFDRLKSRWPEAYKAKTLDQAIAGLKAGKPGGYATDTRYDVKIAKTALSNTPARERAERRVDNIFGANPVPTSAPKPGVDDQRVGYNPIRDQYGDKAAIPQGGAIARLADQLGQYRQALGAPAQPRNVPVPQTAPRPSQTITPNKVNTFTFSPIDPARFEFAPNRPVDQSQRFAPMPANVDPARFSPQASLAELANQYSQYQRGTPATAPTDIAPSRPTANVDPARFAPAQSPAQLANQYSQYQRGTVPAPVSAPAQTASIDPSRFDNISSPQPNMTPNDVRHSYHNGLAGVLNPPSFADGPTTSQSVRDAQAGLAKSNQRDQFARDILKGIEVEIGPPSYNVDRGRFGPGPSNAELANQYSQYGNRVSAPTAPQSANVFDMIDIPQSATIADQYRSYGAGKIAPQVASTATQASPAVPNVAVPGPIGTTPQSITDAAKGRFDAAKPGVYQGIPPSDIYDQNAPGRSGFKGFGAGGFLGNLLTGNAGNMAGIDQTGGRGINVLGALLGAALGGVPGAAIGALGPAIMGGIGRGGEGQSRGGDGSLSPGAVSAGWTSNNPEFSYGGYGSGYDPTPV